MKAAPGSIAVIREADCIGCTKCIPVCPTNAIVGASKQRHVIIAPLCIGCGLCLGPCPTDCIVWEALPSLTSVERRHKADLVKHQIQQRKAHQRRVAEKKALKDKIATDNIQQKLCDVFNKVASIDKR
jgi:electron transport complex protein RnfB